MRPFLLVVALLVHQVHVIAARFHHHHQFLDHHHRRQHQEFAAAATTPFAPSAESYLDNVLVVDEKTGIQYNPYSKHYPGRHVCSVPKQANCKNSNVAKYHHRSLRFVYQNTYANQVTSNQIMYVCCPGWTQVNNRSHGCNKPKCSRACQNGGTCSKPETCVCPTGYTGRYCEQDVDECREQKPCDQICHNTPGSYRCHCRENFALQQDGQSCRKEGGDEVALEAKDLEYELLDKRLLKLETMIETSGTNQATKKDFDDVYSNLEKISNEVSIIKSKLYDIEHYKNNMYMFKNKLSQIEKKADKIDELVVKYEKMKKCAFHNKICI